MWYVWVPRILLFADGVALAAEKAFQLDLGWWTPVSAFLLLGINMLIAWLGPKKA
jgi:hypothetical protein